MVDFPGHLLHSYSQSAPLEVLAFVLAFFEEVIPPIPSLPLIIMIGSFARVQEYIIPTVFIIALFSAAGKTLGGSTVYYVVDKLEDVFVAKYGKYFGIKVGQLEALGTKLGHHFILDYIVLTVLRATPLFSSTLISVGCGILRIPIRIFIISTYVGSFFRDCLYLYVGYTGVKAFANHFRNIREINIYIKCAVVIGVVLLLIYLYLRQRKLSPHKNPQPEVKPPAGKF